MEGKKTWRQASTWLAVVVAILSLVLLAPAVDAKSKRHKGSKPLPRGVAKAPVCETSLHPKIVKVTPDPVRPGQKITIKGQNFGKKACFKRVSFNRKNTRSFKFVNSSTVVATVPKRVKSGLTPLNIMTAGGSAEYILLVDKSRASKSVKKSRKAKRSKKARKSKRSQRRSRR